MKIRSIYRFFQLEKGTGKIQVRGTNIELLGKDISRHLKESKDCIIVAATLGHEVDRLIRYYERINMTKALILDTSASVAIEEAINKLNGDLKKEVSMDRKALTSRFSPGYGDFPLSIQSSILDILGAKKSIGLTVNLHNILIPRKSITAILGIADSELRNGKKSCDQCGMVRNCSFSKGGKDCEN
jgi:hypothetical protein